MKTPFDIPDEPSRSKDDRQGNRDGAPRPTRRPPRDAAFFELPNRLRDRVRQDERAA